MPNINQKLEHIEKLVNILAKQVDALAAHARDVETVGGEMAALFTDIERWVDWDKVYGGSGYGERISKVLLDWHYVTHSGTTLPHNDLDVS